MPGARCEGAPQRRGKPPGAAGANLYAFIGPTPPPSLAAWTFKGSATRPVAEIAFDASVPPGTQVWLSACWYNPRAQSGPLSRPLSAHLSGGGVMAKAA